MISMQDVKITDNFGRVRGMQMPELYTALEGIAKQMIANGWTVLPSIGKTPNLIKWKEVDRSTINHQTLQLIHAHKSTSINVLMADLDIYAIDVDFYSEIMTRTFMTFLKNALNLEQFFTVRGKKGLKIFLKIRSNNKLPTTIGPTVMIKERNWTEPLKHEVELKHQVSTVAGLYPHTNCLYDEYPGTISVVNAKTSDLPVFDGGVIDTVQRSFQQTLNSKAFDKNFIIPFDFNLFEQKLYSILCYAKISDPLDRTGKIAYFIIEAGEVEMLKAYFDYENGTFTEHALTKDQKIRDIIQKVWSCQNKNKLSLVASDVERYYRDTIALLNKEISKKGYRYTTDILQLIEAVELTRIEEYQCKSST